MALDVYFREDIRNALLAAEHADRAALQANHSGTNEYAHGYQAGYQAALITIALAFGLVQPGNDDGTGEQRPTYLRAGGYGNGR
jgi:hypothetical protein